MNTMMNERVHALRNWMRKKGICAFITPSTDPHSGEYVPDHWKSREWISGFNGSAGTAVVTLDKAALWTDNRYFLAAEEQLEGTPFELMKLGLENTPTIAQWLGWQFVIKGEHAYTGAPDGGFIGIDGTCYSLAEAQQLEDELWTKNLRLVDVGDPYDQIWTDRPAIPVNPVEIHPLDFAGETAKSKLERIGTESSVGGTRTLVVSALDEVCWALNLRGTDVQYNPVFVGYLVAGLNATPTLYVNPEKLTDEVKAYLEEQGVTVRPYEAIFDELCHFRGPIGFDPAKTNCRIARAAMRYIDEDPTKKYFKQLSNAPFDDCLKTSPTTTMKIMKNETEIRGYHSAMLKDGIAMVKWMKWALEVIPQGGQTELSLSRRLEEFRAEQPLFRGVSFETIMGYGAHAAIVHYEPTPESDIPVEPRGLLLCDSGGQYLDGTTDITRTLPIGVLTWEERRDYTLVLRGWINLARAVFPRGTYGTQLDALAREPMWKYGINYLHGTGHGVGSYLNVHEGPHQFRMNYMPQPLVPGMTITDEPGIYIAGSHGVRHENTMLIVEAQLRECTDSQGITFGPYYQFEQLTLCPILTSAIVTDLMQPDEIAWFNAYQQMVFDRLAPHLDEEHRQWLREATRPL